MKNMQDTFSIYFACLQIPPLILKQWIYTVSGPFLQIKWANMHRSNIFLIEALSMLASPQIKTVKPSDKKPGISDRSFFCVGLALNVSSFGVNCVTTFPWSGCFKSMFLRIPKILHVLVQDVPYGSIMKAYFLWKRRLVNDLSVSAT